MPNKTLLTEKAQSLGITVTAEMTKAQISAAIKAHEDGPGVRDAGAVCAGVTFTGKALVEFSRHIVGPPRRSKGQRVWLTPALANRQGLTDSDITIVTR